MLWYVYIYMPRCCIFTYVHFYLLYLDVVLGAGSLNFSNKSNRTHRRFSMTRRGLPLLRHSAREMK